MTHESIAMNWSPPALVAVTRASLRVHHPALVKKLYAATLNSVSSPATTLERVFHRHFGQGRAPIDRLIFLHYASPIVRKLALELTPYRAGGARSKATALQEQLSLLGMIDPEALRMIDMHCFGRCTLREIARLRACAAGNSFSEFAVVIPDGGADTMCDEARHVREVACTVRFWFGLYRQCQRACARRLAKIPRTDDDRSDQCRRKSAHD